MVHMCVQFSPNATMAESNMKNRPHRITIYRTQEQGVDLEWDVMSVVTFCEDDICLCFIYQSILWAV